jgi:hypothetical protein
MSMGGSEREKEEGGRPKKRQKEEGGRRKD